MATRRAGNQSAFLAAFSICGQVKMAARAAGIDRASHYYWKANDPAYVFTPTRGFLETSARQLNGVQAAETNLVPGMR